MLKKTMRSKGRDRYSDHTLDLREWSAPFMVSPKEIEVRLRSMDLVGRTVEAVRIMGHSLWHAEHWLEEDMYRSLPDDMPEEEKQIKSDYANISDELVLARYAHVDEPFQIRFADGDTFEIVTPQEPEYRFSLNCIPWDVRPERESNVDASVLFSPFLKQRIAEVEVTREYTDTDPMLRTKFDEKGTRREIVIRIMLWLENGVGVCVSGWFDYCDVACIGRNNEVTPITFGELKCALHNG